MSERLLRFLLSELKTVRVVCPRPQCGGVVEVSIEQLSVRFANNQPSCPLCNQDFVGLGVATGKNPLVRLADAILEIQGKGRPTAPEVQVEFVLPDNS